MMRSVPTSCTSPTSVLNGCPASATSSPMRKTRGSRRISSAIASRTASPYVSSRTAVSVVAMLTSSRAPRLRQVRPGVKNRPMGVVGGHASLYARSGVIETWLVDLDAGRVEIHRDPRGSGYRDVRIPRGDETFSPGAFDLALTLRDLLG